MRTLDEEEGGGGDDFYLTSSCHVAVTQRWCCARLWSRLQDWFFGKEIKIR
jgi:hypothetical protein